MKTSLHNLVLSKGMLEKGNSNYFEVIKAGIDIVEKLINDGKAKIIIEDGKRYIDVYDYKDIISEYYIQQHQVKLVDSTKVYLKWQTDEEGNNKSKASYIVKPTYVFKQVEQPKSLLKLLGKQNAIKWRVNKWILDFERENKSENYTDKFIEETKLMRQAVELTDKFYLGHRFDKRGRLYSDGYLLNYQSDEWGKAAISPCIKPEKLTKEGIRQFKIDIANHCGLDKSNFDERIAAYDNSYDTTSINNGKVKKPLLAHKAVLAFNEAQDNNYITDYVVGVDATASGMQILAILANCSETAKYTNLTDSSQCYDIYGEACKKILEYYTKSDLEISDIRDIVKKALMTRGYNSEKQVEVAQNELCAKGVFLKLNTLLEILDISDKITKCKNAMNDVLLNTFSQLSDNEQIIRYTMPDGFIVEFANICKVETIFTSRKFKLQMTFDKLGWDKDLNWRALAPNLVHSIDAYICREMIHRCNFQIVTIHDCFYCHPNNVLELRKQYIKLLKEIQSMNMLEYICKQINSEFEWKIDEKLFEISDDENSYCLC